MTNPTGMKVVAYTSDTQLKAVRECGDGIMMHSSGGHFDVPLVTLADAEAAVRELDAAWIACAEAKMRYTELRRYPEEFSEDEAAEIVKCVFDSRTRRAAALSKLGEKGNG